MKKITKLFLLIALMSVSALASAQSFTIADLVDLAPNGKGYFENAVSAKGYTSLDANVVSGDLAQNTTYTHSGNSKITLITPTFATDVRMVSWEFNSATVLNQLKNELKTARYRLHNTERRNGGKYVSLYYSRPGVDIILTTDKTVNPNGIYIASVKYTNAAKYVAR